MTEPETTAGSAGFDYDVSDRTVVVRCLGCGWRHLALRGDPEPRDAARRQAHAHERRAHPGQRLALEALAQATRRARARNDRLASTG